MGNQENSVVDRLNWAQKQLSNCRLCPRECRVDRFSGKTGWCGAHADSRYYMDYVHYGEESMIVPSHTIYLTGCNLKCIFCHTALERKLNPAVRLTPKRLKQIIKQGQQEGARNINFLGGEPMVNLPSLLTIFSNMEDLPPVVWNTNLYCSAEALSMVDGLPDIYLADLKFGNSRCSEQLAESADYWNVLKNRLRELYLRVGADKIIVRHLVLPGHINCCTRPVLEWIAEELDSVRVSLKLDYLVMPTARKNENLKRFLAFDDIRKAKEIACILGLRQIMPMHPGEILKRNNTKRPARTKQLQVRDMDLVISPTGGIFLHHPTQELTELVLRLTE